MKLPNLERAVIAQDKLVEIRLYHLTSEVDVVRRTAYGMRYEIRAPLQTPSGRPLFIRTIWQIDEGTSVPRLITLIPD